MKLNRAPEAFLTGPFTVKDGEKETSRFVASSAREDLAGDTIDPKGWVLPKEGVPFLWQHKSGDPPIGWTTPEVEGKKLMADVEWDMGYSFAAERRGQVLRRFIRTCSVGFWPIEYEERYDEKRRFLGYHFTKQLLMELSLVNSPANPDAVVVERGAKLMAKAAQLEEHPTPLPRTPVERTSAGVYLRRVKLQQQKAARLQFSRV